MPAVRFPEDVTVAGNLYLSGALLPGLARTALVQEDFVKVGVPISQLRIWDAFQTPLSAAASDDLGVSTGGTYGTDAPYITGGDLKELGATTRRARFLFTIPFNYVGGQSARIVASAGVVTSVADTSCTLDFEAFALDEDGTVGGSDLVTTAATSINSLTFDAKNFDLNGAGLAAGDILDIRVSVACNDAATATAVIPAIASLALALDVKG